MAAATPILVPAAIDAGAPHAAPQALACSINDPECEACQ
jgi:hypothetical protein